MPSASFRLLPNGQMDACCINESVWLGRYPEVGLHEAWTHPALLALRDALAAGDYSQGCQSCGQAVAQGTRHLTHGASFDRFLDDPVPSHPRVIEFSLSNQCNLACVMCSGDVSSTIRHNEGRPPLVSPYGEAFFEELADFLPHLESAFFAGGEPFLSRLNDRAWQMLVDLGTEPHVGVTTNGTVWNPRVEELVRALQMKVSISMDGFTAATNESIRLGVDHATVLRNRDRFVEVAASYGSNVRVNFALQRRNWHELADLLVDAEDSDLDVWMSPVRWPADASILHLPHDQLAAVDRAWERQEERVAGLDLNRKAWDQARAEVTAALAVPPSSAVPIATPTRREAGGRLDEAAAIRDACAELGSWSGADVLVLRAVDGVTVETSLPTWLADGVAPIVAGTPVDAALASIQTRFGTASGLVTTRRAAGCTETSGSLAHAQPPLRFRTIEIEWVDAGAEHRTLVVATAPST